MSEGQGYNGWTNYETWVVSLWMDNEESSYNYWRQKARGCWKEASASETFTKSEVASLKLADHIKEEHEEVHPLLESASVFSDLLNAALSEVNWLLD